MLLVAAGLFGPMQSGVAQGDVVTWGSMVTDSRLHRESFVEIAAGSGHTVARRSDGSVVAWGHNSYGQCNVPSLPPGLIYVEIAAGSQHTVARRSDGSVVAWGGNGSNQLNVPQLPPGLTYVEIAAGGGHTVARMSDGSVVAWGANFYGQCNVPQPPPGLAYVGIDAGDSHTVACMSDGSVVAWGDNSVGQINVTTLPAGLTYVEVAAGGYHTVARRSNGSVVAWGANYVGQCNAPRLPPGHTYVEVAAGVTHTVARASDGSVVTWANDTLSAPALPAGLTYVEVAAGDNHTVARRSDGSVVAWGNNTYGLNNVPSLPPGLTYVEIAAGYRHTVARMNDGWVLAWGDNNQGQCYVPALPPGVTYAGIAAGDSHTVARRSDGSVVAWGNDGNGQITVPALPAGLTYVEIAAGYRHTVARRSDGSVLAWGENYLGQCNVPSLPPGLTYVEIAAGYRHTVARRSDGSVLAWGDNGSGQCNVPALPPGLSYLEIAAGQSYTAARVGSGGLNYNAEYIPYGTGCGGAQGVPTLFSVIGSQPHLGATFTANIGNMPTAIGLMASGFSAARSGAHTLPLNLGPFGLPGCTLFAEPLTSELLTASASGTAHWSLTLPTNTGFLGASMYQQAFCLDYSANSVGLALSNAARLSVGPSRSTAWQNVLSSGTVTVTHNLPMKGYYSGSNCEIGTLITIDYPNRTPPPNHACIADLRHIGVDIAPASDPNVRPIAPGTLVAKNTGPVNCAGGYGYWCIIEHRDTPHGTYYSFYAHFDSEVPIPVGTPGGPYNVTLNTVLNPAGNCGTSFGRHVHLEIRRIFDPGSPYFPFHWLFRNALPSKMAAAQLLPICAPSTPPGRPTRTSSCIPLAC